jgi:hypothetical protein
LKKKNTKTQKKEDNFGKKTKTKKKKKHVGNEKKKGKTTVLSQRVL